MSRRGVALAWPALASFSRDGATLRSACATAAAALNSSPAATPLLHSSAPPQAATYADRQPPLAQRAHQSPTAPGPSPEPTPSGLAPPRRPSPAACTPPASSYALTHAPWGFQTRSFGASGAAAAAAGEGGGGPAGIDGAAGGGGGETRISLGDALNQLVDAAVEKVEAGQMDEAVSLLKDGLNTFEPVFPNSPELGELHNQAALLLLFQGRAEEAAHHAQASLETTKRHFGGASLLTAHRLLRLGVCRFAQGKMADAAGLLREALDLLGTPGASRGPAPAAPATAGAPAAADDPGSRAEAGFYLDCVALAHVKDAGGVEALTGSLRGNVRAIKEAYGADSMILSLAMSQHSRLVNGGLEQSDFAVGEALLKQQIALLTEVSGPDSEDVAVARYKLGTYYYANDMLPDAGAAVRQAAVGLRAHYPEEHDLVVLCKHRLGMICAAQGDHRSASQLLQASRKHFGAEGGQGMLAKEADIGLAMAKFRAVDASRESPARRSELQHEALDLMRTEVEALAQAIGHGHMLVQGATRYYGQLAKMAR